MKPKKPKHALVICNGEMPPKKMLLPILKTRPFIVCADGGANKARSYAIEPHCIIGDLDSITQRTRHYFSSVPVVHVADQNSTDLEKALDYLLENKFSSAVVVGATGARPDHELSNFSILLKYHSRLKLTFFDELCTAEIVQKRIKFPADIGQQISLVPLGRCTGIVTTGLKYPLWNEPLELGVREGSSNEASRDTVEISLKTGSLLLFKIHPHIKK